MAFYKTMGEYMYLFSPIIFFIINLIFKFLGLKYFNIPYWFMIVFSILYPIIRAIQFKFNTGFTKKLYLISVNISLLFASIIVLFILMTVLNYFIDFSILNITLLLSLIVMIIGYFQARSYSVTELKISSKKIKKEQKIVQLSDTHFYGSDAKKDVSKMVFKIKKLNPDIIVITGDLLDYYGVPNINSLKPFDEFKKVYYVYGNHERELLLKLAPKIISESKIIPLINETTTIGDLQLIGIDDDISQLEMKYELKKQKINENKFSILLQHKPFNEDIAANKKIDLMLSGHWHAGFIFPLNLALKFLIKYLSGTYRVKDMYFHISKGTGTRSIPFRFGFSNEITLIKLMPVE